MVGSVVVPPFCDCFSCLSLASLISLNLSDGFISESDVSITSYGFDFNVIFWEASFDLTVFKGDFAWGAEILYSKDYWFFLKYSIETLGSRSPCKNVVIFDSSSAKEASNLFSSLVFFLVLGSAPIPSEMPSCYLNLMISLSLISLRWFSASSSSSYLNPNSLSICLRS